MVQFLVDRPIAVLVSFFGLLLLGLAAYWQLPASLLPDTDIPQISVSVKADDYSASQVEQQISTPLRSRLQQLRNLKHIESTSSEGKALIRLEFEHGTHTSLSFIEVNEKVDMAMNDLPREVPRPLVYKASVANIPVFNLMVYPTDSLQGRADFAALSHFAREVIRRRLEQLPEVAMVDLSGTENPQVQIEPNEAYLHSLDIQPAQLIQALREHQISLGNVLVRDGHYQYYLRFSAGVYSTEALAATALNIRGRLLRLGDLANIRLSNAESRGSFSTNGHRAITFSIIKQPAAKMDDLRLRFGTLLKQMRADYPDLAFITSQDQTALLDFALGNLEQDLLLGGILAFACMLLFIRKGRPALLIGVTIPITLAITQLGFYLLGISLNVISLGGLILGLGMIIDNSIVVIDTITLHREQQEDIRAAAIHGSNEIIRPLITSMLSNCAVYVPLIFLSGLAGAIFYDQAVSITIGVVSSLLVAVLLLPPLYVLVYRRAIRPEKEIRARVSVTHWYELGLKGVFRYPALTVAVVLAFLASGVLLFNRLDKQRLPPISKQDMEVRINWNEPVDLATSEQRIGQLLRGIAGTAEYNVWAGEQQYLLAGTDAQDYTQARLYVRAANQRRLPAIRQQLANAFAQRFPQALINIQPAANAFDAIFAQEMAPLRLEVSAAGKREMPPEPQMKALQARISSALPHARIHPVALHDKLVLEVRADQAALYGLDISVVRDALLAAVRPTFIDNYQGSQSIVPMVLLHAEPSSVQSLLEQTFVQNKEQASIRLSQLLRVRREESYQQLSAGSSGPYYPLDIYTEQPAKDLAALRQLLASPQQGVSIAYTGSYFDNWQLIRQMALILGVSVLLLYFILAAQFESLLQPLFILAELPVDISGALLFLWLAGNSLNLMSMIGIVIMCGLIINDSILKIDAINQLRRRGMPLMQAIQVGGHKRLKPIVMISLTSIGALLPTLFMHDMGSELQKPLALALIGGMLVGMFISLFFVPLIYWFVYRKQ